MIMGGRTRERMAFTLWRKSIGLRQSAGIRYDVEIEGCMVKSWARLQMLD